MSTTVRHHAGHVVRRRADRGRRVRRHDPQPAHRPVPRLAGRGELDRPAPVRDLHGRQADREPAPAGDDDPDHRGGGHRRQRRHGPDVRRPRVARCGRCSWPGSRGRRGPSSRTASATGCSSTCTSRPATFLVLLVGRGGARLAAGAMGTLVALVFAVIVLGLRIDLTAVALAAARDLARAGHRADPRDRRAPGRDLPPDPPGELVVPGRVRRGACSWSRASCSRSPSCPTSLEVARPHQPDHLVGRGRPPRGHPRRAVVDRRRGIAVDSCHRYCRAGRRRPSCSPCA